MGEHIGENVLPGAPEQLGGGVPAPLLSLERAQINADARTGQDEGANAPSSTGPTTAPLSLSDAVVAQVTLNALHDLTTEVQALRRDALREAVATHGVTRVAAALGISRTALHALTREPGTPRHRVPHPSEPAPTGPAHRPIAAAEAMQRWGFGYLDEPVCEGCTDGHTFTAWRHCLHNAERPIADDGPFWA